MGNPPIYLQLYQKLREAIVDGTYPWNSKFPSKRVTAAAHGVSVVTAQHAYDLLCEEGYLTARERSGYYVAYRSSEMYAEAPRQAAHTASLQAGETGEELPFAAYARVMRRVLTDYGERLMVKSPNNGCPELREAVASYLAMNRGIRVSPEQIVIGSGAEQLYGLAVQLLGRDCLYALEDPSYSRIRQIYSYQEVTYDLLPMGPDGILSEALWQTEATVLHVTPFHSYPTGVTASASKRQEYLRWARQRNGWLIEDDFDSEFTASTKAEDTLYALAGGERVLYVNTFSKTVAPSLRAGYMLLPESLLPVWQDRAGFLSCTVPVAEQMLLAELMQSGEFARHINRVRRRRRQQARQRREEQQ